MRSKTAIEYLYFTEAWILLHVSRLFILFFPFKKIASILGVLSVETDHDDISSGLSSQIEKAIHRATRYTIHFSKCYDQAIAGKLMCKWRRLPSTIYFGLSKSAKGDLLAHAWLRVGHRILTGKKGCDQFTVVAIYGDQHIDDNHNANKSINPL